MVPRNITLGGMGHNLTCGNNSLVLQTMSHVSSKCFFTLERCVQLQLGGAGRGGGWGCTLGGGGGGGHDIILLLLKSGDHSSQQLTIARKKGEKAGLGGDEIRRGHARVSRMLKRFETANTYIYLPC